MTTTAAILAVGSELLAGQIVNGNAAWLSTHLGTLGICVTRHVTVDDDETDIVMALQQLALSVDVIIITGGLGPTSDDLTRHAVAAWAQTPLEFDAASWDHVKAQLTRVGVPVPEANRQQCYFPAGAKVLTNTAGTANGFQLDSQGREVWVLPGPPREIAAIWTDHMLPVLREKVPLTERKITRMWRMIGKGESHLAEIITPLVQGHDVGVAYRVHAPYVELKVSYLAAAREKHAPLCDRLTAALEPWLFESDQEHTPLQLAQFLSAYPSIAVIDMATHGHLAELLTDYLRDLASSREVLLQTQWRTTDKTPTELVRTALEKTAKFALVLVVAGIDSAGNWAIGWRLRGTDHVTEHAAPFKHSVHRSRSLKAIAALALKAWKEALAAPTDR